jgi:hypothetical protein
VRQEYADLDAVNHAKLVRSGNVTPLELLEAAIARIEALNPVSNAVITFPRGEAAVDSEIDVVVVRPDSIDENDEDWATAFESWRYDARAITGNSVEVVEASLSEARSKLRGAWPHVRRDGATIFGLSLDQISESVHV